MVRFFLMIILISNNILVLAGETYDWKDVEKQENRYFHVITKKPLDGFIKERTRNGINEFIFTDGILLSKRSDIAKNRIIEELFYENGTTLSIGAYKDHVKHGKWKYYHPNGLLSWSGDYGGFPARRIGIWKYLHDDGTLGGILVPTKGTPTHYGSIIRETANWNPLLYESWHCLTVFYNNGNIKTKTLISNGEERSGLSKSWFVNGKLKSISNWEDGDADGLFQEYDEKGSLLKSTYYIRCEEKDLSNCSRFTMGQYEKVVQERNGFYKKHYYYPNILGKKENIEKNNLALCE